MDEDLRSSYFHRGPRRRSSCREFFSGRCYRGASCHYLHLETYDRSRDIARSDEQNRDKVNMGIISRSWSPDRQRSRPLGNLGADKPRPEVCLKYCKGRCTLGESCKYLHSFHEYAKSASDLTKPPHFESAGAPRNSGGLHQCDPLMKRKEPDGFFDEKNKGKHADNAENPNITDVKDGPAVRDQQKCEVFGEETARNCDCFQADEKNILCHGSFKRRRSSSRSPSSPRDNIDGRKTGIDESQDNCHWQRRRCGFPFAPGDDFGRKKIKRDESYNNIPKGRCHYAAPSRLPYSHSYRYNGPKNNINKEPQLRVAASVVDPSSLDISEDPNVNGQTSQSLVKSAISRPRRNLLVLDVNGLLADIVNVVEVPRGYKPDTIITMKAVFKRPFCDDFLGFCFDRFDVGVWSSRNKNNVDRVVDFLMLNTKKQLLFCWDQAHCTKTGYNTVENRDKPLVLKELKKLWEQETDFPWEKGFYDETNTVLVDDSPYKALCNPPYTAIFPYAYKFRDARDKSLGRGGELRVYLEKLAATDNVQKFIEGNPFGQRPITKSNLSWGFYSKIVVALANQQEGSSNDSPGMKAIMSPVSQLERDKGTSPASSSDGDHEEQQKGNAEDSHATKSAGDHTQQQEENADKVHSTKDLGSHLDGQDGTVDNSLATRSAATHVNQQGNAHTATHIPKENVNNTPHSKNVSGALSDRQVGNADDTSATNVQAHGSEQKGNAVGIPHS